MTRARTQQPDPTALLLVLILVFLVSSPRPIPASKVDSQADPAEIPLDMVGGRPQVDVYINGEGPYPFVLDTGSSLNVLDSGIARELGLEVIGEREIGAPGMPQIPAEIVTAGELAVGGIEVGGIEVGSIEVGGIGVGGIGVEAGELVTMDLAGMSGGLFLGVLRFSAFADRLATLDLSAARLILSSGSLDPDTDGVIAFDPEDGLIDVPVSVGGRQVTAHIDTGSPGAISIPAEIARDLTFLEAPVEAGQAKLVGGQGTVSKGRLRGDVVLGPVRLEDPEVMVLDLPVPKVNIGSRLLAEYLVRIDQRLGLLLFEPRPARRVAIQRPAAPAGGRRLGFRPKPGPPGPTGLHLLDGGLAVDWVEEGSLAAVAGLRQGDLILSINGTSMPDFDARSLVTLLGSDETLQMMVRRDGSEELIEIP